MARRPTWAAKPIFGYPDPMRLFGLGRSSVRYDMFDVARSAEEARRAVKLASLYHRGQDLAWDGREVLQALIDKHGGIRIDDERKRALGRVFDVILWGELAAWKISAELADQIVELEPKMAATSQAHDEARHFYVMYDYLTAMGYKPSPMARPAELMLDSVIETRSLAKKLIGMQLMVETMALTLFQTVRETRVEPVLADLLRYYEKDEARHVGLGVQYLPALIAKLRVAEAIDLFLFQIRILALSMASLKSLEPDLRQIGVDARRVMTLGRAKQLLAFEQLWAHMGIDRIPRSREVVLRTVNGASQILFPDVAGQRSVRDMVAAFLRGWATDLHEGTQGVTLEPQEPAEAQIA